MGQRLRFYVDVLLIAVGGGVLGFLIAKGRWYYGGTLIVMLPIGIDRMWEQYRPDAAERRADVRRRRFS